MDFSRLHAEISPFEPLRALKSGKAMDTKKQRRAVKQTAHYFLFGGAACYPAGGIGDYMGRYSTPEEAISGVKPEHEWAQIVDIRNPEKPFVFWPQFNKDQAFVSLTPLSGEPLPAFDGLRQKYCANSCEGVDCPT